MKKASFGIALAVMLVLPLKDAVANQEPPLARANRHALIIGIGNYIDPSISRLRGVVHDVENARGIARSMGVPETNIRILQDANATYENVRSSLREVAARVRDGDRLFVYYSGHGTRFPSGTSQDQCREAFIPADATRQNARPLLTQEEIAADLAPAYAKADKVFLFFDACHSGGIQARQSNTRSKRQPSSDELEPKFALLDGTAAHCRTPSNVRIRTARQEAVSRGAPANNVVQLSSSKPDEVSLDSPATGGLVTSAWRYCSTYAEDVDNSGTLSVGEISLCVQDRVDKRLKNQDRFSGQHLVLSGATDFAPFRDSPSPIGDLVPTSNQSAQRAEPSKSPTVESPRQSEQTEPTRLRTEEAGVSARKPSRFPLQTILAQSDARHVVSVERRTGPLKIGRDFFDLSIKSSRGGYVYLILQSSDNESTYVIFPNALDQNNKIAPGEWLQLPRASWRLQSTGPAGSNSLLVIVADAPRSLADLRAKPDGPFVKTLNDRSAAQSLAWVVGNAAAHSLDKCATEFASKDLEYVEHCSDSFGAAVVEFLEVR